VSDPLLSLISTGLKLWVCSRCDSVGSLDLSLQGSSLGLLRGHLQGARLEAREVCFQGLPLQHAVLSSGPIQVDLQLLQPGRMLALHHPFRLAGDVTITGRGLNDALLSESWRWLGDWLSEQLMGLTPLGGLRIDNDVLELQSPVAAQKDPARRRFRLKAAQNTVMIQPLMEEQGATLLPMDPEIHIQEATLQAGQLILQGEARVTP